MVELVGHDVLVSFGDACRVVTVVELGFTIGLAVVVSVIYWAQNRRCAPNTIAAARLRHVVMIGISWVLLAAFGIAEIQGYYGTVLTWRTPVGWLAANLGLYALAEMLAFETPDHRDLYHRGSDE